ncbi:MAG: phosphate--AMP phosphotransferase, partial [Eubacteriales bacterium]|nr:phosphate--AMP phosphotransferase [Eubacteriales bacterium]
LDPRGYKVYPIQRATDAERRYPRMRRYWKRMPAQGNISLFCSSWYRDVSHACFEEKGVRKHLGERYNDIVEMESQLVCDGTVIIKFFLHIPRKEQKRRLKALESKKSTRWRVTREDWAQNEHYEEYLQLFDSMIARTHFDGAVWHVLRSDNKKRCVSQVYEVVIDAFEKALADRAAGLRKWDTPFLPHVESMRALPFPQLYTFEPDQALTENYKEALDKAQKRLSKLHSELYRRQIPVVLCFEGWDAAGKGGAIRRLTSALDARGFEVVPIASPTPLEKSHHHLWRFWTSLPKDGHIAIYDRTWYGRVMVERIEGFCTENQWKRAYEEMNRFERSLTRHGAIVRKFWLQIDNQEQLKRFSERQNTPEKQWKITDEDWRNREKWPQYEEAVNDMLQKTNTADAPWVVVEANNKQYARLKVLRTVIEAIEERLEEEE